jgi:HK97 gp10 family phage protein
MTDSVSLKVKGLDALLAELTTLPQALQTRVMKGAVATGASVIRKKAIDLAPQYTGPVSAGHPPPGTLKKAIFQTRVTSACTPTREVWKVDVRRGKAARSVGKKGTNLDAFYALWVEFGHYTRVPHEMTKTAKAAGRALGVAKWVPPHPFMRPAVALASASAFDAMRGYLQNNMRLAVAAMQFVKVK